MKAVLLCQATLKHHIAAIPTLSTRWGQIQLCQHDQLYDDDEAVCWVILHDWPHPMPCLSGLWGVYSSLWKVNRYSIFPLQVS